jgi:hypothetical protein
MGEVDEVDYDPLLPAHGDHGTGPRQSDMNRVIWIARTVV